MGFDREKGLAGDSKDRGLDDEVAKQVLDELHAAPPGKRTLIEQQLIESARSLFAVGRRTLLDRESHPPEPAVPAAHMARAMALWADPRSAFDDYRLRGLQEVLAALASLRGGRGLMEATLTAAGRSRGQPLPSLTSRPAPPDPSGQAMWQAAERRAVTLYRRAMDSGDVKLEDPTIEEALARSGGGQPLPAAVRRKLEIAFGVSLDRVRIHTDSIAADAARAVHANAFTVGEDIFFAERAYEPETSAGQKLLTHELAHVVQAYQGRITAGVGIQVSSPGESLELEAEAIAERIGDQAGPKAGPKPMLATSTPRRAIAAAASGPAIMRQAAPPRPLSGRPVQKHGLAYQSEGVNLRETASPSGKVVQRLGFNTRVFVDSQQGGWYFVTTRDGRFGYCAVTHLKVDLPEPNAKIHWIQSGDTALSISHKHYGGKAEWGSDHRFFVNGLVHVNRGQGKRGIFKPEANADWDTTKVLAGFMIWIPSLEFMKSLRGKVSSGSISYEAWQSVKSAAEAVGEFLLGAGAFIAGVLHGALESLWDVLVGLKDLAVMTWDILKSVVTGNLLSDAEGLWNELKNLDWKKLVQGWLDEFDGKWNSESILKRWHFRGWVVGYVVMEVLMLFLSGGVIQGIKWVGKATKITKVIQSLPRLQKLAKAVKGSKAYQQVATRLTKGGDLAKDAKGALKWIDRLLVEPKSIWGKGPDQIADVFRKAGCEVVVEQSKKGSKLSMQIRIKGHKDIQNIQVHPGGGRHGGAYYKISSSSKGVIKVVDKATYVATKGEKATIVLMSGPQGWLLQAAAANSAAQRVGQEIGDELDTEKR